MFSPWTLPSRSIWTTEEKVGSPTGRLQAADWGTLSMRPVCKCLQALGGQAQALGASTCAHEIEAPLLPLFPLFEWCDALIEFGKKNQLTNIFIVRWFIRIINIVLTRAIKMPFCVLCGNIRLELNIFLNPRGFGLFLPSLCRGPLRRATPTDCLRLQLQLYYNFLRIKEKLVTTFGSQ